MLCVNPAALSLLGFGDADEIIGYSLFALVAEDCIGSFNLHVNAAGPIIPRLGFESNVRGRVNVG